MLNDPMSSGYSKLGQSLKLYVFVLIPFSKSEMSNLCDTVQADDEAVDLNKALMDKLLELDDVDAVFSNQK